MVSYAVRLQIYERDQYQCYRCERQVAAGRRRGGKPLATLDHLIPKCRGGTEHAFNLRTCCYECNHRRGNKQLNHFSWIRLLTDNIKKTVDGLATSPYITAVASPIAV